MNGLQGGWLSFVFFSCLLRRQHSDQFSGLLAVCVYTGGWDDGVVSNLVTIDVVCVGHNER